MSWTVTTELQELVFELLSVTVSVTLFNPRLAQVKAVGEAPRDKIPQASVDPLFTAAAVVEIFPEPFRVIVRF